jgi:predicted KAP-like P-loop ATPase
MFSYLTYIPITGKFLKPLPGIAKGIGSSLSRKGKQKKSLINQKEAITKKLSELNQKIIVIIDDIDRLNNEQICLIFQLVNSVAGFPNVMYILSFDKEIVARALTKEQNCDGKEYLEKIIQVPFDIPIADKNDINELLFEKLNQITAEYPEKNFDNDYWYSVFTHSISPFINTIILLFLSFRI